MKRRDDDQQSAWQRRLEQARRALWAAEDAVHALARDFEYDGNIWAMEHADDLAERLASATDEVEDLASLRRP